MPCLQHFELSSEAHTHHLMTWSVLVVTLEASSLCQSVSQSISLTGIYSFGGLQQHQIALAHMSR